MINSWIVMSVYVYTLILLVRATIQASGGRSRSQFKSSSMAESIMFSRSSVIDSGHTITTTVGEKVKTTTSPTVFTANHGQSIFTLGDYLPTSTNEGIFSKGLASTKRIGESHALTKYISHTEHSYTRHQKGANMFAPISTITKRPCR